MVAASAWSDGVLGVFDSFSFRFSGNGKMGTGKQIPILQHYHRTALFTLIRLVQYDRMYE